MWFFICIHTSNRERARQTDALSQQHDADGRRALRALLSTMEPPSMEVNAKRKSRPSERSRGGALPPREGRGPGTGGARGPHGCWSACHRDGCAYGSPSTARRGCPAVSLRTLDPSRIGGSRRAGAPGPVFTHSAQQLSGHMYRIQHGCGMADPHEVVERADARPALVRRGWLSVVRDQPSLCLRETLDVDAMLAAARTLACGAPRDFSALAS